MRVVLYYRVSTKLQEDKYSLSAQKQELTSYAKSQGWNIVAEFKDVDSGGKLDKVGLNSLMDFVEEGKADVVMCIDQDRLSRLDTIAWEYLKSTLRDNGVMIAEPGNIVDLTNEDHEFISDIKNLIAKREKRAIVNRMMRGKRQRLREGKAYGKPPWEYVLDKSTGKYLINEKWSWVVPFIDDLYLNGEGDRGIVRKLNDICKTPTGKLWNESHVASRLKNKAYHGIMEKTYSNGETITVENVYPVLRSDDTWRKIQEERSKRFNIKKSNSPHLLRRIKITCGYCGRVIRLKQSGPSKRIHYYLTHGRPTTSSENKTCPISINSVRVEDNLIKAIKDILLGEEAAKKYVKFDYDQSDLDKIKMEIRNVTKVIESISAKIDKILDLYLEGDFPKEKLNERREALEKELDFHKENKAKLEAKENIINKNLWNYDLLYNYLAVAERFDVLLTDTEKMNLVATLFPTAVLDDEKLLVNGELPGGYPLEVTIPVAPNPFK